MIVHHRQNVQAHDIVYYANIGLLMYYVVMSYTQSYTQLFGEYLLFWFKKQKLSDCAISHSAEILSVGHLVVPCSANQMEITVNITAYGAVWPSFLKQIYRFAPTDWTNTFKHCIDLSV